jgi:hypothetical protein
MIDYYLKFPDEVTATSILYTIVVEVQDENGNVLVEASVSPNYQNIDTIGVISKPTGEVDAEGNPVMAPLEGWHVNVRTDASSDATAELEQYQIFPVAPMRVWAS